MSGRKIMSSRPQQDPSGHGVPSEVHTCLAVIKKETLYVSCPVSKPIGLIFYLLSDVEF